MDNLEHKIRVLYPMLQNLARKLLAGNEATAQDIVQDCMLNLWSKRDLVQNPEVYCVSTVKHLCYNALYRKRYESVPLEEDMLVSDPDYEELVQYVAWVSESLPEILGTVLKLKYQEGCTQQEIAEILHINRTTVHNRLVKAQNKLKRQVFKVI